MEYSADQPSLQISIDPGTVYISTNPDQSSYANLTVSIKNSGAIALSLSSVAITLPSALAPASTLNSIVTVAGQPELWIFASSEINTGEFDAIPVSGNNINLDPDSTWYFQLQMVTLVNIISQPSADITVAMIFGDESTSLVSLNVAIDAAVASISFNSEPASIDQGENARLNWNCEKIDYCVIDPIGSDHLQPSGTLSVSPLSTTIYTLYAYGDGIILSAQWAVSVENPQIISFDGADGQSSVNCGDNIILNWSCNQFTKRITLTNDAGMEIPSLLDNGNTPQKGSVIVGPVTRPVTFTFNAYGDNNQNPDQRNTLIMVNDLVCSFSGSPTSNIWMGDNITLNWNIQSACEVNLSPPLNNGPSLQNLSGSIIINPATDVTYTLNVSGYKDNLPVSPQYSVPLQVQQVIINSFTLSPGLIVPGINPNQATLAWDVKAQVFSINNGIGTQPAVNSMVLNEPVNGTVYTLTAGTNQTPGMQSNSVVVRNAYGPFTFNSFQNYDPCYVTLSVFDPALAAFMVDGSDTIFFVTLTGITPVGTMPPSYWGQLNYDPQQTPPELGFLVCSSDFMNPLSFSWVDPNSPTGTVTVQPIESALHDELKGRIAKFKTQAKLSKRGDENLDQSVL